MVVGLVLNLAACEAAVALRAADRGVLLASVAPCQRWIDALPAEDAAKHRASLLRYFFQAASAAAARAPSEGGQGAAAGYAEAVLVACSYCPEGRKRIAGVAARLAGLPGVPSLAAMCAGALVRVGAGAEVAPSGAAAAQALAGLMRQQALPDLLEAAAAGGSGSGISAEGPILDFLQLVGPGRRVWCATEVLRALQAAACDGGRLDPVQAHRCAREILGHAFAWDEVPATETVPFVLRSLQALPLQAGAEVSGCPAAAALLQRCAEACKKNKLPADTVALLHMTSAYLTPPSDAPPSGEARCQTALQNIEVLARLALKEVKRCCGKRAPASVDQGSLLGHLVAFRGFLALHGAGSLEGEFRVHARKLESEAIGAAPKIETGPCLPPSFCAMAFLPQACVLQGPWALGGSEALDAWVRDWARGGGCPVGGLGPSLEAAVEELVRLGAKQKNVSDRESSLVRRSRALALAASVLGREGETGRALLQALEALRLRSELFDSFSTGSLKSSKWHIAGIFCESLFQASQLQERLGMHVDAMGLYREGLALAKALGLARMGCWFQMRMANLHIDCGEVGRAQELCTDIQERLDTLEPEAEARSFEDSVLRGCLLVVSGSTAAKRGDTKAGAKLLGEAVSMLPGLGDSEPWEEAMAEAVGVHVKLAVAEAPGRGAQGAAVIEELRASLTAAPQPRALRDRCTLLRALICVAQASVAGATPVGGPEEGLEAPAVIGAVTGDSAQRCLDFIDGEAAPAPPAEDAEALLLRCFKGAHGFPRLQRQAAQRLASLYSRKNKALCVFFLNASIGAESRHHVELLAMKDALEKGTSNSFTEKMSTLSLDSSPGAVASTLRGMRQLGLGEGEVTSAEAEDHVRSKILAQVPEGFAVVTMNIVGPDFMSGRVKPGHTALVVTRLCRGCEPVGVHIPLNTASSACVLLDSGGVPRVPGSPLEEELDAIMQESVAAVKSAKPNMSSSEKRAWWKARILLDERLGGLISKMDAAVRPWRFLFSGSSGGPCCLSQDEKDLLDLCMAELGKDSQVDTELYRLVCRSAPGLSDEELRGALQGVFGPSYAAAPSEIAQMASSLIEKVRSLQETNLSARAKPKSKSSRKPAGPASPRHEPAVLVLDSHLQGLPWEASPSLATCRLYRMPSLGHIMAASARGAQSPAAERQVDCSDVYYLLNPGGDLKSTQETFEGLFESQGWDGAAGKAPPPDFLARALEERSLFLYFGHGCCEQFLPARQVQKLRSCASAMLMGCSSGRLLCKGEFDPRGTVLAYLNAGCPAAVANLWDVTDRDIDRFANNLLAAWLRGPSPGELLGDSMAEARGACKLSRLIGAAPVCYGLPIPVGLTG